MARQGRAVTVLLGVVLWLGLIGPAGATASQPSGEVVVLAATSLTEPFVEMARLIRDVYPHLSVVFSFAGSQTLRTQLEQGAAADVFASAKRFCGTDTAREQGIDGRPLARSTSNGIFHR